MKIVLPKIEFWDKTEKAIQFAKWLKDDYPIIKRNFKEFFGKSLRVYKVIFLNEWNSYGYDGTIQLGFSSIRNRNDFRDLFVHECLHLMKIHHDTKIGLKIGFYSEGIKDTFTSKVTKLIFDDKQDDKQKSLILCELRRLLR